MPTCVSLQVSFLRDDSADWVFFCCQSASGRRAKQFTHYHWSSRITVLKNIFTQECGYPEARAPKTFPSSGADLGPVSHICAE
jgi:hypothetical protein